MSIMDRLLVTVASIEIIISIAIVLVLPFSIGIDSKDSITPSKYILSIVSATMVILLSGRVLGWW